jgi:predicted PurR-regulated permease PerM
MPKALVIACSYVVIHQFENHLFYPLVVKKIIGVPPIIVILALIIGAKLAGFLGLLLSVPVATMLMEYFNDLEKSKLSKSA